MIKKLIMLLVITSFCVLSLTLTAQASPNYSLLKIGSTGSNVIKLQTELDYLGYSVGAADGVYGIKTKAGVIAFQKANSLVADGIVGTNTANALSSAYAKAIINTAKKYIGIPYKWGGESSATGFDCSGFVQYVFAQNGINLPRVSSDQYNIGTSVNLNELVPGDLIFFSLAKNGTVDHVGIFIGNDQFINASTSKGVTVYTIGPYWGSVELGARRVF